MSTHEDDRPTDFESYWSGVQSELEALPLAAELTALPLHSNEYSTVYAAHFTSIGPYRLFAWYSVPRGDGPFPALYQTPRYGSVVHAPSYEDRQRCVCLALRHRGQRRSDQPYAAAYPGLLTDGVDDPTCYIYRGIVADCLRALAFLRSRPEVDSSRIAVVGDDLALITAALHPPVRALHCTPGLFYRAAELAPQTSAYPLEEFNDYARTYPDRADAMRRTLAYFDPIHFAPQVQARTLLVTGNEQDFFAPQVLAPLADAIRGPVTRYQTAHSAFRDGVHQARWLAERLESGDPVLPGHWE